MHISVLRNLVIGLCLMGLFNGLTLLSQDSLAAQVFVEHGGVQVQRNDSSLWLPLRAGAVAPLGPGDTLRTDQFGRVIVSFLDAAELFVLPGSRLELSELKFPGSSGSLEAALVVEGHVIQNTAMPSVFSEYTMAINDAEIKEPADLFAVWSAEGEEAVVTVAVGATLLSTTNTTAQIMEGSGARVESDGIAMLELDRRLTAPHLIGLLDGCPGTISTNMQNINTRVAPGLSATVIGSIPNGAEVRVMAQSESQNWLRIQYLSGFGWISTALVEQDCTDLTTLPNNTFERNLGLFDITSIELAFLQPFYGSPDLDLWFYRSLRERAQ